MCAETCPCVFVLIRSNITPPFCGQASYGVEDPEYAVTQLAQTTMRSELGKLTLDKVFRVRSTDDGSLPALRVEWKSRCTPNWKTTLLQPQQIDSEIASSQELSL